MCLQHSGCLTESKNIYILKTGLNFSGSLELKILKSLLFLSTFCVNYCNVFKGSLRHFCIKIPFQCFNLTLL